MSNLEYLKNKYNLSFDVGMPIVLNHFGRRTALIELFKELGFKTGAEMGTDHGQYAQTLCEKMPDLELHCIDPWVAYTEGEEVKTQDEVDVIYEQAKIRLKNYNCKILRKTSMKAVEDFEEDSLDFVFIDGNHEFEYVYEDITEWAKKVKQGGIIAGHDYTIDPERKYGVIEAVQKYIGENKINPWFVLHVPPHVPKRKRGNLADCWMFVK
jgi:predicted O-methyltransferase YrrM